MSTVEEIEAAIEKLPRDAFWSLTDRLIALREEAWDRQIEADVSSGQLDRVFEQADRDFEAGRCKEL
jgi:hypothetical protein